MDHNERRICLVWAIVIATLFVIFCFAGCSEEAEPLDITDVYARGVEVEYDGLEHSIVIENITATDVVYYRQADGTWQTNIVAYTVPGEYTVEFRVERAGYKALLGSAVVKIKTAVLGGIYSTPRTVIYDGDSYGINIFGAAASDTITYSIDGELFESAPISFSEVGEHVVFFRVVREYAEYCGSGIVTVLPDIRGEYINTNIGVITLTSSTAILGDDEQAMSYGIDGSGKIGEHAFSVADGVLAFDGVEYVKKPTTDNIYELEINDSTLYIIGGASVALDITFAENTGMIVADGTEVACIQGVNYCESVDADRFHAQITAAHTEIELSLRAEQSVAEDVTYIVYDGENHSYQTDYDGVVWYLVDDEYTTTSPEFDAVGRYETPALYKKDGYLPVSVTVVMEIVQSIHGIYYNDNTVIEIDGDGARINGQSVSFAFVSGQWTIGGAVFGLADGRLKRETTGDEYSPTDRVIAIAIGERCVVKSEIPTQLIITVASDGTVVITQDGEEILRGTLDGDVAVTMNDNELSGIEENGTMVFALGVGDFTARVAILRVEICESE